MPLKLLPNWPEMMGKIAQSPPKYSQSTHKAGPGDREKGDDDGFGTGVATKVRTKTKKPSLYRVLLLNDDYTPMEFVIAVLQEVFAKSQEDAFQIMMHVHKTGVGQCGVFPHEVAESKVMRVMDTAQKNQHPLQCVMEKQ